MTTSAQFQQLASQGYNLIPVYRQRLADTILLYLSLPSETTPTGLSVRICGRGETGHAIQLSVWVNRLYSPVMRVN